MVDQIVNNFPNSSSVKTHMHFDDIILDSKKLSALGIITNEILTNIMKYAFPGREDGIITISALLNNNRVYLTIHDNGISMPESIDFKNSPGFGLLLISMMTEQIHGTIRIERESGTKIILEFNL
jgi:two-component sensor histidine kinase